MAKNDLSDRYKLSILNSGAVSGSIPTGSNAKTFRDIDMFGGFQPLEQKLDWNSGAGVFEWMTGSVLQAGNFATRRSEVYHPFIIGSSGSWGDGRCHLLASNVSVITQGTTGSINVHMVGGVDELGVVYPERFNRVYSGSHYVTLVANSSGVPAEFFTQSPCGGIYLSLPSAVSCQYQIRATLMPVSASLRPIMTGSGFDSFP